MEVCNYDAMWSRPGNKWFHTQRRRVFEVLGWARGFMKLCVNVCVCVGACVGSTVVFRRKYQLSWQDSLEWHPNFVHHESQTPLLYTHWLCWLHISLKWLPKRFYYYWKWHEDDCLKMQATFPLTCKDTFIDDNLVEARKANGWKTLVCRPRLNYTDG